MYYFTYSEAGYNRSNEDTIAVASRPTDAHVLLCVLADGQGGRVGGATASHIAVQTCLMLAAAYSVAHLLDRRSWNEIVRRADEAVSVHPDAGFTMLIGLCVVNTRLYGASCGDSTVLLVRNDSSTILTDKQRKIPPIGSGAAIPVGFTAQITPGSKVLMMSDGVWRGIGIDAIADYANLQEGRDLIAALRQRQVEQNHGQLRDDFSIIVVQSPSP